MNLSFNRIILEYYIKIDISSAARTLIIIGPSLDPIENLNKLKKLKVIFYF